MDEDINSPPFPGAGATTELLYERLKELRAWILHYRDSLNAAAQEDVIERPTNMAKLNIWAAQPVFYQFRALRFMRWLREQWDELIRNYEDCWDSRACVRRQLGLLAMAAHFFNDVFTPFEVREAKEEEQMDAMQAAAENFSEIMQEMLAKRSGKPKKKKPDPSDNN